MRLSWFAMLVVGALWSPPARAQAPAAERGAYFPPRGEWEHRKPSAVGMDDELVGTAVTWAMERETEMPRDFSTQAETFGKPLGPVPKSRAGTNGVIVRRGYIVAEFGDVNAVDPTYSVAKSYLSTILGLAIDRGMIKSVTDRVGEVVRDGGYESGHNAKVTWQHHATQTSEWEGELFREVAHVCREEGVWEGGAQASGTAGAGDVLRVQRCAGESVGAVAPAGVEAAAVGRSEDGDHGSDRGVGDMEVPGV